MTQRSQRTDDDPSISRRSVLRNGAIVGATAVGLSAAAGTASACGVECVRTPGYWKTHPEEWPLEEGDEFVDPEFLIIANGRCTLEVGKELALEFLRTPARGNKCLIMIRHLIAAMLNVRTAGSCGCIDDTILHAHEWVGNHCFDANCEELVGSHQWNGGESIKNRLERFNEGELCAPSCD